MIMVFVLAGFCAYMYTKVMALENQPKDSTNYDKFGSDLKLTTEHQLIQFERKIGKDIDKRDETTRVHWEEEMDKFGEEIIEEFKKCNEYTDQRIKAVNDKFFKVINLDS